MENIDGDSKDIIVRDYSRHNEFATLIYYQKNDTPTVKLEMILVILPEPSIIEDGRHNLSFQAVSWKNDNFDEKKTNVTN